MVFSDRLCDSCIEKIVSKLSIYSDTSVMVMGTLFVLSGSIPAVYVLVMIFGLEYNVYFLLLSIILPLMLTPLTLAIFIRMTKHLSYFKKHLEDEIEANKRKDIIIYEQARFALMGEMMANISHQWKQPLNTIGLSIVKARTSKGSSIDECYEIVEDNVRHLARTIDDFMSFFDKRSHVEVRDMDDIIKEVKSIIESHILSKEIEMNIDMDERCANVLVSSSVSQVILNFLNNSKDAFNEEMKEKKIVLKFMCDSLGLNILCADNGIGIGQDIRDKIFNPYFTTKHKMQGTGIGLYMSRQIVNKFFDGKIEVLQKNEFPKEFENMSTCFSIFMPYSQNCIIKDKS